MICLFKSMIFTEIRRKILMYANLRIFYIYVCVSKTIVIIGYKAITLRILALQEIREESYRIKLSALFHDLHLYSKQLGNM